MYGQVFGCIYLQCRALPQTYGLTFTQKSQYLLSNAIHRATFQLDGSLSQTFWILQYAFLDFRFYSLSVTWWDPIFKNLTKLNIVLIWILITCHVIRKKKEIVKFTYFLPFNVQQSKLVCFSLLINSKFGLVFTVFYRSIG